MIGKDVSPALVQVEGLLLDKHKQQPGFTEEGFRAATYIFLTAMMDKMFDLQEKEGIPLEHRCEMAAACGNEIREIVKKFCDIDTYEIYK